MSKIKALALKKVNISAISQFIALTGIATVAPLLGHQIITGSIINTALFISVVLLGIRGAVLIALVPSLIAFATGLLPSVLAPMIPFMYWVFESVFQPYVKGLEISALGSPYIPLKKIWLDKQ